jgi:restriction system protein
MILDWIRAHAAKTQDSTAPDASSESASWKQESLWKLIPYQDDSPTLRSAEEFAGAVEHLHYAVFRRYNNQLTRAERARLDNSIENILFKIDRYIERLNPQARRKVQEEVGSLRDAIREGKERVERLRRQGRRAELKLAQLATMSPEEFEEFVAELFEAIGYEVQHVGGSGDEGADLLVQRGTLRGVVQCKFHKRSVIGSPQLQRFLGTVHHTGSHKGFFVTTSTFSLAAEKFVAEHPIELIDGPRLIELVQEAIGPGARRENEPSWF